MCGESSPLSLGTDVILVETMDHIVLTVLAVLTVLTGLTVSTVLAVLLELTEMAGVVFLCRVATIVGGNNCI
jgi:hypothetical protein